MDNNNKECKQMIVHLRDYLLGLVGIRKETQAEYKARMLEKLVGHIEDEGKQKFMTELVSRSIDHEYNERQAGAASGRTNEAGFKRMLPTVSAHAAGYVYDALKDVVGIQPMNGPVGLVYSIRYKEVDTGQAGQDLESGEMQARRMTLEVVSETVEARTRKLSAKWTIEAAQDMGALHGIDFEEEMCMALGHEIGQEVVAEQLHNIALLGKKEEEITPFKFDNKHRIDQLLLQINEASNEIGRKTRRGCGNYIIVSPTMLSVLQMGLLGSGLYKQFDADDINKGVVQHVGTLNGTIKVMMNQYAQEDVLVIGYKGGNGETDCGYKYCPYIMAMSTGVVVDPMTYQPLVSFMTRYGQHEMTQAGNAVGEAADYYYTLKVDVESFDAEKHKTFIVEKTDEEISDAANAWKAMIDEQVAAMQNDYDPLSTQEVSQPKDPNDPFE